MSTIVALPFKLKRSQDALSGSGITTTTETVHGLLSVEEGQLVVQWRLARKTDHVGGEIRTDEEFEAVREVRVPLAELAGITVRRRWWEWPRGPRLEIVATDLGAFEEVAGQAGLKMAHPAQMVLRIARRDRLAAEEFAAEVALALAEGALEGSRRHHDRLSAGLETSTDPTEKGRPRQAEGRDGGEDA